MREVSTGTVLCVPVQDLWGHSSDYEEHCIQSCPWPCSKLTFKTCLWLSFYESFIIYEDNDYIWRNKWQIIIDTIQRFKQLFVSSLHFIWLQRTHLLTCSHLLPVCLSGLLPQILKSEKTSSTGAVSLSGESLSLPLLLFHTMHTFLCLLEFYSSCEAQLQ